jgi:hypothetical protein
MSISSKIPRGSKLCIVGGVFKATFSTPTISVYDFTNLLSSGGNRVNLGVPLGLNMSPNYLYFIHKMYFSMSIEEGIFLASLGSTGLPTLYVKDSTSFKSLFHFPFRMLKYFDGADIDSFHLQGNGNANLIADFQGKLNQVEDTVGVDNIYAQVSFSVYEITDQKYIQDYKKEAL